MAKNSTPTKTKELNVPVAENTKGIENHKNAARHLNEAAKHHLEAAKHHEDGNHKKAAESTVKAHGHYILAGEHQNDDVKNHSIQG